MKNSENHKNKIADKITITVKTLVFITGVFFVCRLIRFQLSARNNSYAFFKLIFFNKIGEDIFDKFKVNFVN